MHDFTTYTASAIAEHVTNISTQELIGSFVMFILFSITLLFPPQEFVSAGFTVECICSSYLGDPLFNVVDYQARKVVVNRAFVGFIPFLFSFFLFFFYGKAAIFTTNPTTYLHYYTFLSMAILFGAVIFVLYHHFTNFKELTTIKKLRIYSDDILRISLDITEEYKNYQNFTASLEFSSKFVVSDNWVLYFTRYNFYIVNLNDVTFQLLNPENHPVAVTGGPVQILPIRAIIRKDIPIPEYSLRINSSSYRDLQVKLAQRLISNDIILLKSLHERFVDAFIAEVENNPRYECENLDELEPCLGCSIDQPNVKLHRNCIQPDCQNCNCRPMWCIACMGRIFAAKQDQDDLESWMSGKAACPTCRAIFCMQDIEYAVKS